MRPLVVPHAMDADTLIQVTVPKLRRPLSENICAFIFFNFVHRTTSHGAVASPSISMSSGRLLNDDDLECVAMNAGDVGRGDKEGDEAILD